MNHLALVFYTFFLKQISYQKNVMQIDKPGINADSFLLCQQGAGIKLKPGLCSVHHLVFSGNSKEVNPVFQLV